jgi:predicted small lipoprotein YifL
MKTVPERRRALALVLSSLFLAACGQSGPLYLPENPSRIQVDGQEAGSDAAESTSGDEETDAHG